MDTSAINERAAAGRRAVTEAASTAAARVSHGLRAISRGERNVDEMERLASSAGGALLAAYGIKRGGGGGMLLGLLGVALLHRGVTGHCHVYDAMGVTTADRNGLEKQHGRSAVLDASHAIKIEESVTIARSRAELFRFWRNFENLPRIMNHLERVTVLDARRSRWVGKALGGETVEWEAEINNEVENTLIGWRSVRDASVPNAGSVHFTEAPGGGTVVRVVFEYQPAGRAPQGVLRLFEGEPATQVREDLQRFKAAMERGEG